MSLLIFQMNEVKRLYEHTQQAVVRSPTYEQMYEKEYHSDGEIKYKDSFPDSHNIDGSKIPPGLWLVHDQGVYLMSNGDPKLMSEDGSHSFVSYAKGMDPNQDTDWYEEARFAVGGDDFSEFIPVAWIEKVISKKPNAKLFKILISRDNMQLVV